MGYKDDTRDSLPDILLVLPGLPGGAPAFVAVEIERSVKSSKRLFRKLYKYAAQTTLDGVLYLSEDERVLAAIRQQRLSHPQSQHDSLLGSTLLSLSLGVIHKHHQNDE